MRTDRKVLLVLLLFMGVMGALWALGPVFFASRDDPTALDYKPVRTAVLASCTQLRADLAAVPTGEARLDRAEAENRAVDRFIGRIRALGPDTLAHDEPVQRWLGDWERIVAERRKAVHDGKPFTTPIVEGAPINIRMYALIRSGLGKCDVPPALLAPEPGTV